MKMIIKFHLYCEQNDNTILKIAPHKYSLTKLQNHYESSMLWLLFVCLLSAEIYMYDKWDKDGFWKMIGGALGYGILMLVVLLLTFIDTTINFAYMQKPLLKHVYNTLLVLLIILAYYKILMQGIWIVINSFLYNLILNIVNKGEYSQQGLIKDYETFMAKLWFIDILGYVLFGIHVIINYICYIKYKNHPDYLKVMKEYEDAKNKAIKQDEEATKRASKRYSDAVMVCDVLNKNKITLPDKQK